MSTVKQRFLKLKNEVLRGEHLAALPRVDLKDFRRDRRALLFPGRHPIGELALRVAGGIMVTCPHPCRAG